MPDERLTKRYILEGYPMPKRALIEHRPWLLLAVTAAIAFYFLRDNQAGGGFVLGEAFLIPLKGAGVAFLAIYALRRTHGVDGAIFTAALALSALGDMVLELDQAGGALLFIASHLVAAAFYLRNRRERLTISQGLLGASLLIGVPAVSYLLSERVDVAIYGAALGLMAACAWMSRFPRYRVGIGAVLFVLSDWLIFSRMGSFDLGDLPHILIWPLYFAGQLMIATGVVQTLRGERVET